MSKAAGSESQMDIRVPDEGIRVSAITVVDEEHAITEKTIESSTTSDSNSSTASTIPYSAFSKKMKNMIVFIVFVSCFISPLSVNIYFPALNTIGRELNITEQEVHLSITVYMIAQGISPSLWGSMADVYGRRPIYMITFIIYYVSCIGLACTKNYITLLALRMLQAFGASATIAVGAGVIGDISTPAERGGYMGILSMGSMMGPLLGPVLGGIITYQLGWRWIFWILTIFAATIWIMQTLLLPETLRYLVGDGSGYANPTPLQFWTHKQDQRRRARDDEERTAVHDLRNSSVVSTPRTDKHHFTQSQQSFMSAKTAYHQSNGSTVAAVASAVECTKCPIAFSTQTSAKDLDNDGTTHRPETKKQRLLRPLLQPFLYLTEKDVVTLLVYNSLQYAGLFCVITSSTKIFKEIYGLQELEVGLCYLSNGFGAILGSFTCGRLLNWRFEKIARCLDISKENTKRGSLDPDFPIEKARMGLTWVWGIIFNLVMISYGWCLFYKLHIAIPISMNFILSYCSTSTFNATNTLLVDLFPKNSSACIASNNLIRCLLGALATMTVQPGLQALNAGWYFTTVSLILFASRITIYFELKFGPKWRLERLEKQNKRSKPPFLS